MPRQSARSDWESYWGSKDRVEEIYSNETRIAEHLRAVVSPEGKSILEVGSGTGRDSLPLAADGARVYQLDYSYHALRLMEQTSGELPVTLIGGDTFSLPFRDDSFDIVFHQGLLEHFRSEDAAAMVSEQVRVMKPGGYMLIDVPQRFHFYTVVKHVLILFNAWFAGWERSFSHAELRSLMRSYGLEPVYSYGVWMKPSLVYRIVREISGRIGIRLPLYPPEVPGLRSVRRFLRNFLMKSSLPLYTGVCIGIVARKIDPTVLHHESRGADVHKVRV